MSVNKAIKDAVEPIVPVCVPHLYTGSETEYCTFIATPYPARFCDNKPTEIGYSVQVHYCCPLNANPLSKLSQLSDALFDSGFDYPSVIDNTDETGQEYVLETGYTEQKS